jgi:hypothetical protein
MSSTSSISEAVLAVDLVDSQSSTLGLGTHCTSFTYHTLMLVQYSDPDGENIVF